MRIPIDKLHRAFPSDSAAFISLLSSLLAASMQYIQILYMCWAWLGNADAAGWFLWNAWVRLATGVFSSDWSPSQCNTLPQKIQKARHPDGLVRYGFHFLVSDLHFNFVTYLNRAAKVPFPSPVQTHRMPLRCRLCPQKTSAAVKVVGTPKSCRTNAVSWINFIKFHCIDKQTFHWTTALYSYSRMKLRRRKPVYSNFLALHGQPSHHCHHGHKPHPNGG